MLFEQLQNWLLIIHILNVFIYLKTSIFDTTVHQMTIQVHTLPNVCFALSAKKQNKQNMR